MQHIDSSHRSATNRNKFRSWDSLISSRANYLYSLHDVKPLANIFEFWPLVTSCGLCTFVLFCKFVWGVAKHNPGSDHRSWVAGQVLHLCTTAWVDPHFVAFASYFVCAIPSSRSWEMPFCMLMWVARLAVCVAWGFLSPRALSSFLGFSSTKSRRSHGFRNASDGTILFIELVPTTVLSYSARPYA